MSWFKFPKALQKQSRLSFEEVVEAYGAVLANSPRGVGMSIPESLLPFDKTIIAASLIEAAKMPSLPDNYLQYLQIGFFSLADFQPDGGGTSIYAGAVGIDPDELTKEQIDELLEKALAGGDAEAAMTKRIHDERTLLSAQWKEAVIGIPHA